MRRVLQVGLIFALMLLGLAACGSGTQPTTSTTTINDEQNAPAEESDAVRRPQFLNAYADW